MFWKVMDVITTIAVLLLCMFGLLYVIQHCSLNGSLVCIFK